MKNEIFNGVFEIVLTKMYDDEKPAHNEICLCVDDYGDFLVLRWSGEYGVFYDENSGEDALNIKAWAHLPHGVIWQWVKEEEK